MSCYSLTKHLSKCVLHVVEQNLSAISRLSQSSSHSNDRVHHMHLHTGIRQGVVCYDIDIEQKLKTTLECILTSRKHDDQYPPPLTYIIL